MIARFVSITFLFSSFVYGQEHDLTLRFQPNIQQSDSVELSLFKGYLSNIAITFEDGSKQSAPKRAYLLNFLDSTQNEITFSIPVSQAITCISYTLGTDSTVNVSGAYDGDLDPILGMYWAWNSGYINWKMEGTFGNQPFEYHIGGFTAPNATARDLIYKFDATNQQKFTFSIEIDRFLEGIKSTDLPNMLMIPGANSSKMATVYSDNFTLNE